MLRVIATSCGPSRRRAERETRCGALGRYWRACWSLPFDEVVQARAQMLTRDLGHAADVFFHERGGLLGGAGQDRYGDAAMVVTDVAAEGARVVGDGDVMAHDLAQRLEGDLEDAVAP